MAIGAKNQWGAMAVPMADKIPYTTIVEDGKAYKLVRAVVHRFQVGDVEDPDVYAGVPLIEWRDSEMGKWVMERAVETPEWHRQMDHLIYGYQYVIIARMRDVDYTFWQLKWGSGIDK